MRRRAGSSTGAGRDVATTATTENDDEVADHDELVPLRRMRRYAWPVEILEILTNIEPLQHSMSQHVDESAETSQETVDNNGGRNTVETSVNDTPQQTKETDRLVLQHDEYNEKPAEALDKLAPLSLQDAPVLPKDGSDVSPLPVQQNLETLLLDDPKLLLGSIEQPSETVKMPLIAAAESDLRLFTRSEPACATSGMGVPESSDCWKEQVNGSDEQASLEVTTHSRRTNRLETVIVGSPEHHASCIGISLDELSRRDEPTLPYEHQPHDFSLDEIVHDNLPGRDVDSTPSASPDTASALFNQQYKNKEFSQQHECVLRLVDETEQMCDVSEAPEDMAEEQSLILFDLANAIPTPLVFMDAFFAADDGEDVSKDDAIHQFISVSAAKSLDSFKQNKPIQELIAPDSPNPVRLASAQFSILFFIFMYAALVAIGWKSKTPADRILDCLCFVGSRLRLIHEILVMHILTDDGLLEQSTEVNQYDYTEAELAWLADEGVVPQPLASAFASDGLNDQNSGNDGISHLDRLGPFKSIGAAKLAHFRACKSRHRSASKSRSTTPLPKRLGECFQYLEDDKKVLARLRGLPKRNGIYQPLPNVQCRPSNTDPSDASSLQKSLPECIGVGKQIEFPSCTLSVSQAAGSAQSSQSLADSDVDEDIFTNTKKR